jgi:hypothetical protein
MKNGFKTPQRVIMRVELLPEARDGLAEHCDRVGMTQVSTTSRLVEWFCQQDFRVQAGVLGLFPDEARAEIPTLILKNITAQKPKK